MTHKQEADMISSWPNLTYQLEHQSKTEQTKEDNQQSHSKVAIGTFHSLVGHDSKG